MGRREALRGGLAAAVGVLLPLRPGRSAAGGALRLRPGPGSAKLLGGDEPQTAVWCYNKVVPGPEIRVRQGDWLNVLVDNGLAQETIRFALHANSVAGDYFFTVKRNIRPFV